MTSFTCRIYLRILAMPFPSSVKTFHINLLFLFLEFQIYSPHLVIAKVGILFTMYYRSYPMTDRIRLYTILVKTHVYKSVENKFLNLYTCVTIHYSCVCLFAISLGVRIIMNKQKEWKIEEHDLFILHLPLLYVRLVGVILSRIRNLSQASRLSFFNIACSGWFMRPEYVPLDSPTVWRTRKWQKMTRRTKSTLKGSVEVILDTR